MAKLVLCKGIELEPNYEHTFDFANATEQGEYFSSKAYKTYVNFLRIKDRNASLFKGIIAKENYDYLKVDESIDEVRQCTYLYWQDDINSKTYYAFITNSYYVNDGCTIVEYELDVMQTFLFDYHIECAYISREHQDRFVYDDVKEKYIRRYNTYPENLNLGDTYLLKGNQKFCMYATFEQDGIYTYLPVAWVVIVATEKIFDSPLYNVPSTYMCNNNLYIYVLPYIVGENKFYNSNVPGLNPIRYRTGTMNYHDLWTYNGIAMALSSQTNKEKVHQVIVTGYLPMMDKLEIVYENGRNILQHKNHASTSRDDKIFTPASLQYGANTYNSLLLMQGTAIDDKDLVAELGMILHTNEELDIQSQPNITLPPLYDYESKLFTYPYSYLQLMHNNQSVDLKYENIKDSKIYGKINFYGNYSYLVYNKDYAKVEGRYGDLEDTDYAYVHGLSSKTINDLPWTSDAYLNYMLTKSAQAITGVAVKNIAGVASIGAGIAMLSVPEPTALTKIAGVSSIIGGITTGASSIAQELAKQQDLSNVPNTLENMSNDGTMSLNTLTIFPTLHYLEIKPEFKSSIYSYFRLYGYKANRLATPSYSGNTIVDDNMNLKSRYYYNYIKCADINIELAYNRDYHDKIVAIFKSGITFWHYRNTSMSYETFKPFNYRYENIEVSLLS